MARRIWTIVVAAGSGSRFGRPKQFELVAGRRVLDHAVATAARNSDGVVVVVPATMLAQHGSVEGAAAVVAGGASRSESVRCGLAAVPDDVEVVLVHDAARPLASDELFRRVAQAVGSAAAVVPVVAVVDTIRDRSGGVVDRDRLAAVQTPQGFDARLLRAAHASGPEATDDATLVEAAGGTVALVDGERTNLKITEPGDLATVERSLGGRSELGGQSEGASMQLRVGNGFDVHRFSDDPDRPLVLGGVRFDGERGLHGHSDADVVAHAVAEAVLGAAGLGDLGSHFPDTDERWRGADSLRLLAEVIGLVAEQGWSVGNVDCSVIAEAPKMAPRRAEMESALTAIVGGPVTIKGRRAEGIGGLGRREGIAALATALLTGTRSSACGDARDDQEAGGDVGHEEVRP